MGLLDFFKSIKNGITEEKSFLPEQVEADLLKMLSTDSRAAIPLMHEYHINGNTPLRNSETVLTQSIKIHIEAFEKQTAKLIAKAEDRAEIINKLNSLSKLSFPLLQKDLQKAAIHFSSQAMLEKLNIDKTKWPDNILEHDFGSGQEVKIENVYNPLDNPGVYIAMHNELRTQNGLTINKNKRGETYESLKKEKTKTNYKWLVASEVTKNGNQAIRNVQQTLSNHMKPQEFLNAAKNTKILEMFPYLKDYNPSPYQFLDDFDPGWKEREIERAKFLEKLKSAKKGSGDTAPKGGGPVLELVREYEDHYEKNDSSETQDRDEEERKKKELQQEEGQFLIMQAHEKLRQMDFFNTYPQQMTLHVQNLFTQMDQHKELSRQKELQEFRHQFDKGKSVERGYNKGFEREM